MKIAVLGTLHKRNVHGIQEHKHQFVSGAAYKLLNINEQLNIVTIYEKQTKIPNSSDRFFSGTFKWSSEHAFAEPRGFQALTLYYTNKLLLTALL